MGTNALFHRGRVTLILCATLILVSIVAVACSPGQPQAITFPTSTARPTETRVPTVTPIPGGIPPTGILFPDLGAEVTSTPAPTFTLLPDEERYDPLSPTQTAAAAMPTQPLPIVTIPPEFNQEPIETGKLIGGVMGLIPSPQGLWAMRPNGTEMTLLTADPIDALSINPSGTMGLYLTHPNPNTTVFDQPFGYVIKLITLYDDRVYPVAVLDPPGLNAQSTVTQLEAAANGLAAYSRGAIAWAPNGSRVAFVSSHEAAAGQPASSDIYLYTPASGSLTRFTELNLPSGAAHAYALRWSPDSARLYYEAAYSFSAPGTSGGTWLAGAWVAGLDGSLSQLYDGSGGGFNMLDWMPGSNLLVNTPDAACGARDLRVVQIADRTETMLWPGCYADMIYDQRRAEVIVSVTPEIAALPDSPEEGLYRVRIFQPTPQTLAPIGFDNLYVGGGLSTWYGYNPGQGMYAITRAGAVSNLLVGPPYDNTTDRILKPMQRVSGTNTWLFTGVNGGLYRATPGQEIEQLLQIPVEGWTTSPSFPGLHFFYSPGAHGPRLFGVRESDWQPFPVDDRLRSPGSIRWVP